MHTKKIKQQVFGKLKLLKGVIFIILIPLISFSQNSFEKHIIDANFDGPGGIYSIDLNNDGFMDVIAAGIDNSEIAWWEHDGNNPPSWTKHIIGENFLEAIYVSCNDINNNKS